GYIASPLWIAKGCNMVQSQITSANCSIAQRAALAAITSYPGPTLQMVEEYMKRREMVYRLHKNMPGINTNYPEAAFYFFPADGYYFGKSDGTTVIRNADDFCIYMLEHAHVSLVSGGAFGAENCIRLSYAASEQEIVEAIGNIRKVLAGLK